MDEFCDPERSRAFPMNLKIFCQLTCVYTYVVLIVGGGGKGLVTTVLITDVRALPGVRPDVNLTDVGSGERTLTTLKWTFERSLP